MSLTRYITRTTTMAKKKRKPRAKRKQVIPSQPDVIPYSKYRVEWMDILSDSGWATDKEFHRMKLAFPVNEGWLFNRDRYSIKMFASYDKDEDTKEITFGDRTMIPLSCIKKMVKLK
jgi:hypothetical protein